MHELDTSGTVTAEIALASPAPARENKTEANEDATNHHPSSLKTCNTKIWRGVMMIAGVIVIGVGVVVAIMIGGRDNNDHGDTSTHTPTFTEPPTSWSPWDACFTSLLALRTAQLSRTDFSTFVDVSICPKTDLLVLSHDGSTWGRDGRLHAGERTFLSGSPCLVGQSNMRIKCGEYGNLRDQCVVSGRIGGGVLAVNNVDVFGEEAVTNVTFEGITFERASTSLLFMIGGGNITFRNCLFRDTIDYNPIYISHASGDPSIRQSVTFDSCVFEDLRYGRRAPRPGEEGPDAVVASLVLANGTDNKVVFRDCVFRNNQYTGPQPGSLVTSFGTEVRMERTCFEDNRAGQSPISMKEQEGGGIIPVFAGVELHFSGARDGTCDFVEQQDINGDASCDSGTWTESDTCMSSLVNFTAYCGWFIFAGRGCRFCCCFCCTRIVNEPRMTYNILLDINWKESKTPDEPDYVLEIYHSLSGFFAYEDGLYQRYSTTDQAIPSFLFVHLHHQMEDKKVTTKVTNIISDNLPAEW